MTNTRIDYVYADASNYKVWGREVLVGSLTFAEQAEITAACLDGELFIASQVGLPDLQYRMWDEHRMSDDDHVFHRIDMSDLVEVDDAPTTLLTAAQLLSNFRMIAMHSGTSATTGGWDVADAALRLGLSLKSLGRRRSEA